MSLKNQSKKEQDLREKVHLQNEIIKYQREQIFLLKKKYNHPASMHLVFRAQN